METPAPRMGSTKLVLIGLIFLTGLTGCLLPRRLKANDRLLGLANALAGGVILSVAMLHLLPDAQKDLAALSDFPITNLLCCFGLLAVMGIERVFMGHHEAVLAGKEEDPPCLDNSMTFLKMSRPLSPVSEPEPETTPLLDSSVAWETMHTKPCKRGERDHHHHLAYSSKHFRQGLESGLQFAVHLNDPAKRDVEDRFNVEFYERMGGLWVPLMLLLVLGFHSIVEGVAFGAAQRSPDVTVIAVAILSHKFLAAGALGVSFVRKNISLRLHTLYAFVFSLLTPLGSLVGAIIASSLTGPPLEVFAASCQAIGSGTFLYITLVEILPDELSGSDTRVKFVAAIVGFALMGVIALVI